MDAWNLELINLESGVVIQLNTGQSDSEILAVSGNDVLYRVSYQIFTASVTGGQLGKSVLVAEDDIPGSSLGVLERHRRKEIIERDVLLAREVLLQQY